MGRRLLADPDYVNKTAEGREADVRPCTACITCETRMVEYEGLRCQVNASIGRGSESDLLPAARTKRVVVVGGGPAGMEAARVMAFRGHQVTLYEKESRLGGLLNMAGLVGRGEREEGGSGMAKHKRVYEPWQIKNVKFKNRMLKTPQDMNMADFRDGSITQQLVDFYESIAKGGIGGIITEQCMVDAPQGSRDGCVNVHDDSMIPGMAAMAAAAHKHGCPIIMQINHLGGNAMFPPYPGHVPEGFVAVGPSDLDAETKKILFHGIGAWPMRALTIPEIKAIIIRYADAAERVKKAGFDGVELHGDHYYLMNAFLSRMWNRRDDEYGAGSLENRCRFSLEILNACRERVGDDFVIGVKLNGAEYGVPEGTTSEECQEFAKMLEAAGADYFNIVADGYGAYGRVAIAEQLSYPEPPKPIIKELAHIDFKQGMNVHLAANVKKVVSVPVIAVGKLDASLGEKFITEGKCDAVAIGRRLFADPQYPIKAFEGRDDEVRPCTSCITCETRMVEYDGVRCQVNAGLGRVVDNEKFDPAPKPKKVVVVGAVRPAWRRPASWPSGDTT
jgi:2,4-dienoyl-CoA reductase (NADPH2)